MRAVDIIPAKNRNRIGKLANGARITPGISHVPGTGIHPFHARIQCFLRIPANFYCLPVNTIRRSGKKSDGCVEWGDCTALFWLD